MNYSAEEISDIAPPIAKKYGIKRVFLFGSRARGESDDNSDYDFSIDPGDLVDYFEYISFIEEMESVFGKIDVMNRRGLREDRFYKNMIADEILVYERTFLRS